MENVNIIFLTNKAADLNYFKSLPHVRNISVTINQIDKCWLVDNFAFALFEGNYRFYDHLLDGNEKPSQQSFDIIEKFEKEILSQAHLKTILAVHWGERDEKGIKDLLKELNNKENLKDKNIAFSYWGSQSPSYGVHNLGIIREEIIGWTKLYTSEILAELQETIDIFRQSNELSESDYDKVMADFQNYIDFKKIDFDSLITKLKKRLILSEDLTLLHQELTKALEEENPVAMKILETATTLKTTIAGIEETANNILEKKASIEELKRDLEKDFGGFKKHYENLIQIDEIYKLKIMAVTELKNNIQSLKATHEN